MSEISYSKKNDRIECVRYKEWRKSYPPHTHTAHMTVGYIEEGHVCMVLNGEEKIYGAGERFQIPPNTLHEIKTVGDECYSMVVLCTALEADEIVAEDCARDYESIVARLDELQKSILEESRELTCPKSFYVPFTYSGEEEQLNRLYRRWEFLSKISEDEDGEYKSSSHEPLMNLTPIPYEIALGRRLTPKP